MAMTESRPFLTPRESAVELEILSKDPQVKFEEIEAHWHPGQSITVVGRVRLSDKFWVDTYLDKDDPIELVAVATCPPARKQWVSRSQIQVMDEHGSAEVELTVDGGSIAVLLQFDIWITGPGRTSPDDDATIHSQAKLWQNKPITIRLMESAGLFPVGAFSFSANHRREIPWELEIDESAEPSSTISSCMRLYLNTDLPHANAIGLEEFDEGHLKLIDCDLIFGVLYQLQKIRLGTSEAEISSIASEKPDSLAAFGLALADKIGRPLFEAMRQSHESPMDLMLTCREAVEYLHDKIKK